MMNNLADEPPKKSHDLVISASSKTVHAQESMTVDMHHDAHSVDVPARGCGHPKFITSAREYLRDSKLDVVFVES
ncbi:hypothetical protein V6N13_005113 [Hibiscus sabdariffa]